MMITQWIEYQDIPVTDDQYDAFLQVDAEIRGLLEILDKRDDLYSEITLDLDAQVKAVREIGFSIYNNTTDKQDRDAWKAIHNHANQLRWMQEYYSAL